jgi:hypothetical protein
MCPLECNEILVEASASYATYPSVWYANLMLNNSAPAGTTVDFEFLQQNTLKVNVFYNEMGYTSAQESPAMTVDALIATFGGI